MFDTSSWILCMFQSYVCGYASPHCASFWAVLVHIADDKYVMRQLLLWQLCYDCTCLAAQSWSNLASINLGNDQDARQQCGASVQ